ncbi:MAG TPA: sigma-70 family RNA polymerase sigma factor, partial [Candidatus Sumerlaeota bacterium]|nr:sigma-70 family RNA polymerase sigma factor [Candidatus Sumerlaeota bacterium]
GNVGLLEVIEKYDYHKGFRFSTYAAFWIRQAIQIALRRHGSMIALPIRKSRLLGRIAEAQSRFLMDEGREPTTRELADFLHEKEGTIQDLLLMKDSVLSLDTAAVAEDESSTLMDRLTDENALSPLDACVKNQMKAKVAALMEILNEREKRIMRLRFGFEHGKSLSLRKTSALVGLSQEGVRRIEAKALTKLRRPTIMAKMAALV